MPFQRFASLQRTLLVMTACAAGLITTAANAGPIFNYVATVNVATAPTLPSNPPGAAAQVIPIGNGNNLTFTANTQNNIDGSITGGADINYGTVIFNEGISSTLGAYAVNYNYEITITDAASLESGTVNFTGMLSGFARGGANPSINSVTSNYAVTPTQLILGGSTYTIALAPIVGPSVFFNGVLQGNINISTVPEPTSLALAGLATVGAVAYRRRKLAGLR